MHSEFGYFALLSLVIFLWIYQHLQLCPLIPDRQTPAFQDSESYPVPPMYIITTLLSACKKEKDQERNQDFGKPQRWHKRHHSPRNCQRPSGKFVFAILEGVCKLRVCSWSFLFCFCVCFFIKGLVGRGGGLHKRGKFTCNLSWLILHPKYVRHVIVLSREERLVWESLVMEVECAVHQDVYFVHSVSLDMKTILLLCCDLWGFADCVMFEFVRIPEMTLWGWQGYKPSINQSHYC